MSLLGSGAVNQGRHIGLQQLEALAAATHGFLGPNKSFKFIQDEASGEATLVSSCYRLLEQLELSDSVAQLLHETTQAHQKALRSGTSSLVFLAGVWSRVALDCLHQGISIPHIITGMSKGLELCMEACRCSVVTVKEVVGKSALLKQPICNDCMNAEDGLSAEFSQNTSLKVSAQSTARTINGVSNLYSIKEKLHPKHRIKLKHSRHFNSSSSEDDGTRSMERSSETFHIVHLAEAVSHGCEASMNLVIEASRIQSRQGSYGDEGQNVISVDKLVTCLLPGLSEEHSCVLHGYVVKLCAEQASLVKHFTERTLKIGLVNGDLTENYRHVGFNRPKNITYVLDCSTLTGVSRQEEWMDSALGIIQNLSVDVLLVSGLITPQLKDHCLIHNVLVIEHVRASILNDFAMTTGAIPISYITQLCERCVGDGVHVTVLKEYRGSGKTESTLLNIVAGGTSLVTAVITSSVHAKLQSLEDQFWSCAYRLHHAAKDGKLLPGAGAAELLCIHQLYKHMDVTQSSTTRHTDTAKVTVPYEQVILQLMADSWMDYISTLMVNAGQVVAKAQAWTLIAQHLKDFKSRSPQCTIKPEAPLKKYYYTNVTEKSEHGGRMVEREREMVGVYDNVTVKFEAWRRALDLVFLVLQTDTEIITGINESESQYRDFMFL